MRTSGAIGERNKEQLARIYQTVTEAPGITAYTISKKLNLPYNNIYNVLPSLDILGLLLYEDDEGRLYPL